MIGSGDISRVAIFRYASGVLCIAIRMCVFICRNRRFTLEFFLNLLEMDDFSCSVNRSQGPYIIYQMKVGLMVLHISR
jgi:hypothetical protein